MMNAATTSLILTLLLGAANTAWAQAQPSNLAAEEAVRRQSMVVELRRTLAEADRARKKDDLPAAAKLFEQAWTLVQSVGTGIERERKETVAGFTAVRMELAQRAHKRGDYAEADAQLTRVLRVDPRNTDAQALKKKNDSAIYDQRGRVPSPAVTDRLPEVREERIATSTLVQDGRLLLEMGKLEEAEAKLRQAVKQDPENQAAFYFLNKIQESRFSQETRIREIRSRDALIEVEQAWYVPLNRNKLPAANPFATNVAVHTGPGRRSITQKLDRIILDEVLFDGIPLASVVKEISDEARKRDPDKRGINFIINSSIDIPAPQQFAQQFDAAGNPLPPPPAPEPVDLNTVSIRLGVPLRNVRLADVIDAITKSAAQPIKYSIEEYAVVFTQKTPEPQQLFSRTFRVDPNTFMQGLESVGAVPFGVSAAGGGGGGIGGGGGGGGGGQGGQGGIYGIPRVDLTGIQGGVGGAGGGGGGGIGGGGGGAGQTGLGITAVTRTNLMQSSTDLVRNFFIAVGVDLSTNALTIGPTGLPQASGKAIVFNDRTGVIFARATMEELDIMDKALQALNLAPPQVTIETKFTEISQSDNKAIGFDWFLGNTLMNNGTMGLQGGTAPSYTHPATTANPNGTFPGVVPNNQNPLGTLIPPTGSDQLLTSGLRNITGDQGTVPAVATISGILTDPQFRMVVRALEQRGGVDVLSAPRITTLSGRQAKIEIVELRTIVAGQGFNQASSGGVAAGGVAGGGAGGAQQGFGGAVAAASQYATTQIPLGPALDVIPYVSADGYSVQMTIIPTITEFLGYDDPGQFVPQAQSAAGNTLGTPLTAVLPLPRFRVRQIVTSAIVWDGQTIVLGGLISEDVSKFRDKIPVLGDIPFLGRFFRSESMSTTKKNLVVFITPTIIDPAGLRVHTEDNLPYDPSTIVVPAPEPTAAK